MPARGDVIIPVVSTADSGGGSLREAVAQANATPPDTAVIIDLVALQGITAPAAPVIELSSGPLVLLRGVSILANPGPARPVLRGSASGTGLDGVFIATGDQAGTNAALLNPRLAALGGYGGTTRTAPPQPDSPLVDAIPGSAGPFLSPDARGVTRPQGNPGDIGAVELPRIPYTTWNLAIADPKLRDAPHDPDGDGSGGHMPIAGSVLRPGPGGISAGGSTRGETAGTPCGCRSARWSRAGPGCGSAPPSAQGARRGCSR